MYMDNKMESMLKEYKNTILKLRNVYFRLEQKLKKEKGLSQEDTETFLEKKFCEIVRNANLFSKQQQSEQQEQKENNTITNKDINNNNKDDNFPSYFQHFQ